MASALKKLLIVEDADDIQLLLRKLFELENYCVACASDGAEALDSLQAMEELPNLILLDLNMPRMDGYEFLEKQKENPNFAKIPTLIMTADGDIPQHRKHVEAAGFLRKPLDIGTLLNTVKAHCASS